MSKGAFTGIISLVVIAVLGWFGWSTYQSFFGANPDSPEGEYTFVVEDGDDFEAIGEQLSEDDVAQDSFNLVSRLYSKQTLYSGEYELDLPATTEEIVEQINVQSLEKARKIRENARPSTTVTIREGRNLQQVADQLVEEGVLESTDDFLQKATAPGLYQYGFLPEPLTCEYGDRFNCVLYYLEGYLYPDTYEFFTPSTGDEVIIKMLNNFDAKVWSQLGNEVDKAEFDDAVIMASVLEKETGRSTVVEGEGPEVLQQERRNIASVFYNRLDNGMPWSSDPTVNYGLPNLVCQQTTELTDCVFLDDPRVQTPYNTYNNAGYPIGPIASPQLTNIEAVLNPTDTDYLFFVSDTRGVTLFAETDTQHIANINTVTALNNTFE